MMEYVAILEEGETSFGAYMPGDSEDRPQMTVMKVVLYLRSICAICG